MQPAECGRAEHRSQPASFSPSRLPSVGLLSGPCVVLFPFSAPSPAAQRQSSALLGGNFSRQQRGRSHCGVGVGPCSPLTLFSSFASQFSPSLPHVSPRGPTNMLSQGSSLPSSSQFDHTWPEQTRRSRLLLSVDAAGCKQLQSRLQSSHTCCVHFTHEMGGVCSVTFVCACCSPGVQLSNQSMIMAVT
jgi:hypothetical protein